MWQTSLSPINTEGGKYIIIVFTESFVFYFQDERYHTGWNTSVIIEDGPYQEFRKKCELFTLTFNYNEMELFSELHCRVKKRKIWKYFLNLFKTTQKFYCWVYLHTIREKNVNMRICWKFPVSKNWNIFSTHFIKYKCF